LQFGFFTEMQFKFHVLQNIIIKHNLMDYLLIWSLTCELRCILNCCWHSPDQTYVTS
jgi:hypothetical protein